MFLYASSEAFYVNPLTNGVVGIGIACYEERYGPRFFKLSPKGKEVTDPTRDAFHERIESEGRKGCVKAFRRQGSVWKESTREGDVSSIGKLFKEYLQRLRKEVKACIGREMVEGNPGRFWRTEVFVHQAIEWDSGRGGPYPTLNGIVPSDEEKVRRQIRDIREEMLKDVWAYEGGAADDRDAKVLGEGLGG